MPNQKNLFFGLIAKDKSSIKGLSLELGNLLKINIPNFEIYSTHNILETPILTGHISPENIKYIRQKYTDNQPFVLNGKWAVIDLDLQGGRLYLIRDTVGISPIYYFRDNDIFAFSNSIQSLLHISNISNQIDKRTLASFLIYSEIDKTESTLIKDIKEVLPSQSVCLNMKNWSLSAYNYFQLKIPESNVIYGYEEVVKLNRQGVTHFIAEQLPEIEDTTNQTLFLSGGIDSSCIASVLAQKQVKNLSFTTISYPGHDLDETSWARLIADRHPSIPWNSINPNGQDFLENVEEIHRIIEFPTFSTGTFNQFQLFQYCHSNNIRAAWDGLGADALYGGHDYYRHLLFFEFLQSLRLKAALEILGWSGNPMSELMNSIKTLVRMFFSPGARLSKLNLKIREDLEIYNKDFLEFATKESIRIEGSNDRANLRKILNDDFFKGGVRHLSRFSDRLASHFNVDIYYPFSENINLARAISQVPVDQLFNKGRSKAILRDSFKAELPKRIYGRKDKKGLQSPNNLWIDDYKSVWIDYFEDDMNDIYNIDYLKNNFHRIWNIKDKPENYRQFKDISFAIWRKVFELK